VILISFCISSLTTSGKISFEADIQRDEEDGRERRKKERKKMEIMVFKFQILLFRCF